MKMDFQYMPTDHVCISKWAIKENPILATESLENKKEKYLKTDQWYTKAKWPT